MQLIGNNIHNYSFNGAHPTHVSSLVDMQLIPPKRFWYLYESGSFIMLIIVVPRKGSYKLCLAMESGRMCVQRVINSRFRKKNEWMRSIEIFFYNHTMSLSRFLD